ncbi:MAG: hypothetical protein ACR2MP_12555 [Streptosporangiaceae bacterium]
MIPASAFLIVAIILCLAVILAILGITDVYMSGSDAVERDGMMPGRAAPAWSLLDTAEKEHRSPPDRGLQMIVFGDHSLKSFPSVIDGLRELADVDAELEIVILPRQDIKMTEPMLHLLGIGDIPLLIASEKLYGRYNVRVSPFVIVVDSNGLVRGSSLVNYGWQIMTLFRIASISPAHVTMPSAGRLRHRLSRTGA